MKFSVATLLSGLATAAAFEVQPQQSANSTFYNPVLPGWHSDPSCAQVDGTFYCVTSTFISFPGLPVYASRDLLNWKLISHVWNRDSQLPTTREQTDGQQEGMYAATLRYHDDYFYVACEYLGLAGGNLAVIFKSADPYDNDAWSDPVTWQVDTIDPDLFWDDDGKLYVATHSIVLQEVDLDTGAVTEPVQIWGGTGGVWPEGPHIFKRPDGYYYLLIAEGGTETDHAVTMARSKDIYGPYEAYENNPVLTNRGTDEYFQTVGHADLFQDTNGKWWGIALATRGGADWTVYPMGRETVLFPVTWEDGEFPIVDPVRGKMEGWPLPAKNLDLPGKGPFNNAPDVYDFAAGSEMPPNLVYWRVPIEGNFATTDNGLRIMPSRNNVTGTPGSTETPELTGQYGLSFIGRRQTHSLFEFSVDVAQEQTLVGQEAGATVFLTQLTHIDIGVVLLPDQEINPGSCRNGTSRAIRFRTTSDGKATPSPPRVVRVPRSWGAPDEAAIRLTVTAVDAETYELEAGPANGRYAEERILLGTESAGAVSGGSGSFVGALVGVYATCNGAGSGKGCPQGGEAYFRRWRYTGVGQEIDDGVVILAEEFNT